jgi:hypothetical protein
MSTVRRTLASVVAATALALTIGAVPTEASGSSGEHSHGKSEHDSEHSGHGSFVQPPTPYSSSEDFDPGCPGLDISAHFEIEGVTSVRAARGTEGQGFLLKDSYRFSETWVEAGSGDPIFKIAGRFVFEEISAKKVPNDQVPPDLIPPGGLVGPVYLFTATETGRATLRDASGKVLYLIAGVEVFENLFDTLGDSAPGGVSLSFNTVKVIGPHPDIDVCAVAAELTAS